MKNEIINISNLSLGFKEAIFKDINAQIQKGSLNCLVGINGVGKSCFLKTLCSLLPKISGEIKINNKSIENYSSIDLAKILAVVLTEKIHVDYMSVKELVLLGRSPFTNWSGALCLEDHKIADQVMRQVGIFELRSFFFSELSDGQKQKALIARALAQKPKILILDEPTTFLDIPSKIDLIRLLKKISVEDHVAVLMSTHDLELVKSFADQVFLMGNDGSFQGGSPEQLDSSGQFQKHFYFNN